MVIGAGRAPRSGQPVDQLIGAERLVARQQRFQHAAADRRQPLVARGADRLGVRDRVAGAALVIVTGRREHRAQLRLFAQRAVCHESEV